MAMISSTSAHRIKSSILALCIILGRFYRLRNLIPRINAALIPRFEGQLSTTKLAAKWSPPGGGEILTQEGWSAPQPPAPDLPGRHVALDTAFQNLCRRVAGPAGLSSIDDLRLESKTR
jgi:hypothetical protein